MIHVHPPVRRTAVLLAIAAALALCLLPSLAAAKRPASGPAKGKGQETAKEVNVMTRNLYLGADLAPAISASGLTAFTEATGQILREVTANSFPTRAKGLAQEILKKKPDLVGLQEVALWRTGPPSLEVFLNSGAVPTASGRHGVGRPRRLGLDRGPEQGLALDRGGRPRS